MHLYHFKIVQGDEHVGDAEEHDSGDVHSSIVNPEAGHVSWMIMGRSKTTSTIGLPNRS